MLSNEQFHISFDDVNDYLLFVGDKMPLRDYYSKTTYYRIFIAEMFPQYTRAIYIDSDTVVQGDISELYDTDIGDAYVGACHEQVMVQVEEYGSYVEKVMEINRKAFFNAGLLLINCDQFRQHKVMEKFIRLLQTYNFVVTQDEDYLNVICKDRVFWLDQRWNTEIFGSIPYPIEQAHVLHYIMTNKPWHYHDCRNGDIFWHYAEGTSVYEETSTILRTYTDEERQRDQLSVENLLQLAVNETNKSDNYLNKLNQSRSKDRIEILKKIDEYERAGRFDEDVEDDPPTIPLPPEKIDYLHKGFWGNCKRILAFTTARLFFWRKEKKRDIIINKTEGLENLSGVKGAVITCNHFLPMDSFIFQRFFDASKHPTRLYRVIREGNYTSFPGFYGFLMRHCNTLPLSANVQTMKKFLAAVQQVLADSNCLLIYSEQSMWWQYRKPKPQKLGAFDIAVKNNVPVVPCFITMADTDKLDADGFPVQEYTPHIGAPIWPDKNIPKQTAREKLKQQTEEFCREIYETTYGIPLTYSCESSDNRKVS